MVIFGGSEFHWGVIVESVVSTGSFICQFYLAHPSVLVNVGTRAKLSIQVSVILQMLFSY